MSKNEIMHQFYLSCQEIDIDDTFDLITEAETDEEKAFICVVTDFVLQQRQKKAIAEKRF